MSQPHDLNRPTSEDIKDDAQFLINTLTDGDLASWYPLPRTNMTLEDAINLAEYAK